MATFTVNAQTGTTYTLVASDAGKLVTTSNPGTVTITANSSVFDAGDIVHFAQTGAGQITFDGTATVRTPNGASAARAQYSTVALLWVSASECYAIGDTSAQVAAVTSGSISGITDLAIADGGTGASTAADARTNLGVDAAGTDNSTNVTLAGTPDYLTLSGQEITRNQIDLTTDVTGDLPIAEGGTAASTAAAARTNLDLYSTGEVDSAIDTDVATHAALTATHGVSGAIVGTTDSQTLTNKTITGTTNDVSADRVQIEVFNNTGVQIDKGDVVYASGFNVGQDLVEISLADASSASTMPAIGVADANIANGSSGTVIGAGEITGVDTSAFSVGNILFASETAGALTATKPTGSAIVQRVAEVLKSNVSTGVIDVRIDNSVTITGFAATLLDDGDAATARTTLGVDAAGTDNSTNVTLAGTPDYLTLSGQEITRNQIDLTTDVTGVLPEANLPDASAGAQGVVEIATSTEVDTGTDDVRAISPLALAGSALQSKVNGIEAGADVTDAANVETAIEAITFTPVSGATGDEVMIVDATDGGLKAVLWENLPGSGGGISNVVEDTTPQLGGQLDVNGQAIGDGTLELLTFVEDVSAVNHLEIENEATGSGPILRATGDDANVDLNLATKGTGALNFEGNAVYYATGTDVPITDGGTGASTAADARTNLGVDPAGTDNSTNVTLAGTPDYITISGQEITRNQIDLTADVTGVLPEANLPDAGLAAQGVVELATAAETTTGTDATRAVTPDGLAGSEFGERAVQITCVDYTTAVATGDGQGYFHIDSRLAGMDLVDVHAEHIANASSSGTTTIQVRNVTQAGVNMLSTALTIDFGETGSDTAVTSYTIDTANDDVAEHDLIAIDVDAIPTGTAPQGLIVTLGFRLP